MQASDTGATALHLARHPRLGCLRCLETTFRRALLCDAAPTPASEFVKLLLGDARTDPCLLDFAGATAYMSCASSLRLAGLLLAASAASSLHSASASTFLVWQVLGRNAHARRHDAPARRARRPAT